MKPDDDYWGSESTPSSSQTETPITDPPYDYWKPEDEDPAAPVTNPYYDYWKPEEEELPSTTLSTDNYDSWSEVDPTPPAPGVDGKVGTDDSDYWDATCMSELMFLTALFTERRFIEHEYDQMKPYLSL